MGGEAMLKPVAGAVGGTPNPQPCPKTTMTTKPHLYPPSSSSLKLSVSSNSPAPFGKSSAKCSYVGESSTNKLGSVEGREDKRASGSKYEHVFWAVPSRSEVEKALSDLLRSLSHLPWLSQLTLYSLHPPISSVEILG
ncbi:unnamed protein product [Ilex paraguariensis]|uniref:Uncharacterized protein n=1 Tax=Ilex paraguariensis TaxID=185542 RepID=A0ABC8RMK9_9AQUA